MHKSLINSILFFIIAVITSHSAQSQTLFETISPTYSGITSRNDVIENKKFNYIPGKHCLSVKIYKHENPPYLDPFDCHGMYASIIQPIMEEHPELIFWTPKEGSTHFRVLWLGAEVARCEIGLGLCEIFIP